jgi:hypothetical protein
VAITTADSANPAFEYQVAGVISSALSGLAAGTASWVRVSSTGTLERCTPGSGDDLIGKCLASGDVVLDPGVWDANNYAGGEGGGVPGNDTEVVFNDGGSLGADAGLTYDKGGDLLSVAGAVEIGGGTVATVGLVRVAHSASDTALVAKRNAGDSDDLVVLGMGGTAELSLGANYLGSSSNRWAVVNVFAGTSFSVGIAGSTRFSLAGGSGDFLALGDGAAATGAVRLSNEGTIYGRRATTGVQYRLLRVNASNKTVLGDDTAGFAYVEIGNATAAGLLLKAWNGSAYATVLGSPDGTYAEIGVPSIRDTGNARSRGYSTRVAAQTTDDTETSIYEWALTDDAITTVTVEIQAIKSDATLGWSFCRRPVFRLSGGGVGQGPVDDNDPSWSDSFAVDLTIDASTGTGRVRVTGLSSTTIEWGGVVHREEMTLP